ncbi:hypothetical protein CVT26_013108 [Gymnopilus dilepis]|uniref:MARVEL domain-containing protein n=1 Tax=Gymnopilus dilepis TaxID=231916 RepID=A0A409YF73_9AGAR|nr:hypothetical protein CVT26_013108 [Gymnopilus dilepis]
MISFSLIRAAAFATATLFALIELALGAAITNFTTTNIGGYFSFAALGIATAILTFCTLPLMLFLSRMRSGAIPSMVASEFGWVWVLWILWLAVGGSTANDFGNTNCGLVSRFDAPLASLCREVQAFEAFGFLTWIVLFIYSLILTYIVATQAARGNSNIWTIYIMQVEFDAAAQGEPQTSTPVVENKTDGSNFAPQYPPTQTASPVPSNPNYANVNVGQPQMSMHAQV